MTVLHTSLNIPKNTSVIAPIIYTFNVSPMLINRVSIGFPLGCVDLVGVWIEYRSAKLFPANDDGYLIGNGQIIDFSTQTYIVESPFLLVVKGYNGDTVFPHRVWVNIEVNYLTLQPTPPQLFQADDDNFPHSRGG